MLKRRSWLGLALAVPFLPGVARAQDGGWWSSPPPA